MACESAAFGSRTAASPSMDFKSTVAPATLSVAKESAKFKRFRRAPVFTQVSALSEYPLGGWQRNSGSDVYKRQKESYRAKVKTPYELVASTARALNAEVTITSVSYTHLESRTHLTNKR